MKKYFYISLLFVSLFLIGCGKNNNEILDLSKVHYLPESSYILKSTENVMYGNTDNVTDTEYKIDRFNNIIKRHIETDSFDYVSYYDLNNKKIYKKTNDEIEILEGDDTIPNIEQEFEKKLKLYGTYKLSAETESEYIYESVEDNEELKDKYKNDAYGTLDCILSTIVLNKDYEITSYYVSANYISNIGDLETTIIATYDYRIEKNEESIKIPDELLNYKDTDIIIEPMTVEDDNSISDNKISVSENDVLEENTNKEDEEKDTDDIFSITK